MGNWAYKYPLNYLSGTVLLNFQFLVPACGTITWKFLQKTFVIYLCVKQETHNSSKSTTRILIFVHDKEPTKSWHKAVKNMSSHQKLSEWQKVASRFTEVVYKLTKMSASFQAICRPLGFSSKRDKQATEYLWHMLALQTVPGFADFAGVVEITRFNTREFLYLSGWTAWQWTCIRIQSCLFKQNLDSTLIPTADLDQQIECTRKRTFPCSGVQTSLVKWLRGYQANVLYRSHALVFVQIASFSFNCGL